MERISESIVATSDIVATASVMDDFMLSRIKQLGGGSNFTRQYTGFGISSSERTDGETTVHKLS